MLFDNTPVTQIDVMHPTYQNAPRLALGVHWYPNQSYLPNKHGSLNTKLPCFLLSINPCIIKFFDASSQEISFIVLKLYAHKSKRSDLNPLVFSLAKIIMKHLFLSQFHCDQISFVEAEIILLFSIKFHCTCIKEKTCYNRFAMLQRMEEFV